MIEALKNCPNCGGTVNEAGRCEFCGSKVYDFTEEPHYHIRIKVDDKIVLEELKNRNNNGYSLPSV